jgi:hypothetical protein
MPIQEEDEGKADGFDLRSNPDAEMLITTADGREFSIKMDPDTDALMLTVSGVTGPIVAMAPIRKGWPLSFRMGRREVHTADVVHVVVIQGAAVTS